MPKRLLYDDRLSLGSEKSKIPRATTAYAETQTAVEQIEARREELRAELLLEFNDDPYSDVDVEIGDEEDREIDEAAVHTTFGETIARIQGGEYSGARPVLIAVFRELEAARDPYAIAEVPDLLLRLPDLTGQAARYLARVRPEDADAAVNAFASVRRLSSTGTASPLTNASFDAGRRILHRNREANCTACPADDDRLSLTLDRFSQPIRRSAGGTKPLEWAQVSTLEAGRISRPVLPCSPTPLERYVCASGDRSGRRRGRRADLRSPGP